MSTPIPEGSVIITPTEVYKEVRDTHQAVQQLVGRVDTFLVTQTDHENRLRNVEAAIPENLDQRLSRIEVRQAMYTAASGFAGTALGWFASWAIFKR